MTETWRFRDEWLLRALAGVKGADEAFISKMRAEKKPYLSHALLDAGILTEEQLGKVVELTFKIKYLPLSPENADKFGLTLLPEKVCRKYSMVPVGVSEDAIRLALADPIDLYLQADVEAITARRVVPFYSLPRAVDSCLERLFNSDTVIYDLLNKVEAPEEVQLLGGEVAAVEEYNISTPMVKLVNSIISQAYRKHSSDIHIEHEQKMSHVRIRIDGVLKNIMSIPRHIANGPLVSRIKIMADLDISICGRRTAGPSSALAGPR